MHRSIRLYRLSTFQRTYNRSLISALPAIAVIWDTMTRAPVCRGTRASSLIRIPCSTTQASTIIGDEQHNINIPLDEATTFERERESVAPYLGSQASRLGITCLYSGERDRNPPPVARRHTISGRSLVTIRRPRWDRRMSVDAITDGNTSAQSYGRWEATASDSCMAALISRFIARETRKTESAGAMLNSGAATTLARDARGGSISTSALQKSLLED